MGNKYKNAPVSEVILGVTWNGPHLHDAGEYYRMLERLASDSARDQALGPLGDELMTPNGAVQTHLNPLSTGPVLHRFRSSDDHWLTQVQFNKFYLNWIRLDSVEVGMYPGYASIRDRFFNLLHKLPSSEKGDVSYWDLTYQDRVDLSLLGCELSDFERYLNLKLPSIAAPQGEIGVSSVFLVQNYRLPELGGYAILKITGPAPDRDSVLSVQFSIRGKGAEREAWFEKAHEKQLSFFESFFRSELLEKWRE